MTETKQAANVCHIHPRDRVWHSEIYGHDIEATLINAGQTVHIAGMQQLLGNNQYVWLDTPESRILMESRYPGILQAAVQWRNEWQKETERLNTNIQRLFSIDTTYGHPSITPSADLADLVAQEDQRYLAGKYPHTCYHCGGPSYNGMDTSECMNHCK